MKVTLRDIAKAAGVSITTASMALNESGRLSEETRRRVQTIARNLGYKIRPPSPARIEESSTVGILLSIDADWAFIYQFVRPVVEQIKSTLEEQGYATIVIPISQKDPVDDIYAKIQKSNAIAIASLHYGSEVLFEKLENAGIAVVVVMNSNYQAQFYSVCADDYQGAYEGTRELFRMGHRKIAYFDCLRQDLPQLLTDRYFGFHKAIVEYGIKFDDSLKIRVEVGNVTALTEQLKTLLRDNPDITGIFALDDELASWIVAVLSHLGKRIPVDISIIAPGDVLEYGLPYVPQISTMRIDTGYMGKIAAQMILSRMTQNPEGIHVLKVKEQLMNRGSIGVGPAGLSEE